MVTMRVSESVPHFCLNENTLRNGRDKRGTAKNECTITINKGEKKDMSDVNSNILLLTRRARDENNAEAASKYYEQVSIADPDNWEAYF